MARKASRRALPGKGAHGPACGPADAISESDEEANPRAAEQHANLRSSSRLRQKLGGSQPSAAAPAPRPAWQSPTGAQRRPALAHAARQTRATVTRPQSTSAQQPPYAAIQPSRSNCHVGISIRPAAAAEARVAAPTQIGSRKRHAPDSATAGSGEVQPAKRRRAGSEATREQRQPRAEAKAEPHSSRRSGRHAATAAAAAGQAARPGDADLLGTAPAVCSTRKRPAAAPAAADEAGQQVPEASSQAVGRARAPAAVEASPAGAHARQAGRRGRDGRRGSRGRAVEGQAADGNAEQQSSRATPASRASSKREAGQRFAQASPAQPGASPAGEQPVPMTFSRKTPADGAGSVPTAAGALSPKPATTGPRRHSPASHHELAAEFGVAASPGQHQQQQQAKPGSAQQEVTQASPRLDPGTCAGAVAVGASRQLYASPTRQAAVPGRTAAALAHLQPDPAASAVAPAALTVARPASSRPPACKQLVMPGAGAAALGDMVTNHQSSSAAAGQQWSSPTYDPAWWNPLDAEKVRRVQAALHAAGMSGESSLMCRDAQAGAVRDLLRGGLQRAAGAALYVSGVPGTGKSLTVHEVALACARDEQLLAGSACPCRPAVISINCMSLAAPQDVFQRLLDGLEQAVCDGAARDRITYPAPGGDPHASCQTALEALRKEVTLPLGSAAGAAAAGSSQRATPGAKRRAQRRGMLVVICDEVDQLASQDQEVLYELFALTKLPGSRLVLVAVANSLDLTERRLPELHARGCRPQLLQFPAYSRGQILSILQQRLNTLPGPVFATKALEFCARKMAAASGDMRRVLEAVSTAADICAQQAAVEEAERVARSLEDGSAAGSPGASNASSKLVGIGHMCSAVTRVAGGVGVSSIAVESIKGLPQQQQLVVCAASRLLSETGSAGDTPFKSLTNSLQLPQSAQKKAKGPRDSLGSYSRMGTMSPAKSAVRECLLGQLHDMYISLCKQVAFRPLNNGEFITTCSTLADQGLLFVSAAKEDRRRRVALKVPEDDITTAINDNRILRSCLIN